MKRRTCLFLMLVLLGTTGISTSTTSASAAPSLEIWSPQTALSDLENAANQPDIVANAYGRVHLFWVEKRDPSSPCSWDTIMNRMVMGNEWSEPQEILLSPSNRCVTEPAATIGQNDGRVHIVWSDLYFLYYSWAPIDEANRAGAWAEPVVMEATNARRPDIATDAEGQIHVAYYCAQPSWEVFYTQSDDGGQNWASSQVIDKAPADHRLESVDLAADGQGRIHLVWTAELVSKNMSRGGDVFYSRSTDHGVSWEKPLMVDQKDSRFRTDYGAGEIAVATVGQDEVHLAWAGAPLGNRWHQWSSDGGATWHSPELVAPLNALGGDGLRRFAGGMDMAIDSLGRVHLISASKELVHMTWEEGVWSGIDSLLPYDPYWPRIAIGAGNQIYVVGVFLPDQIQSDPSTGSSIWFMRAQTNAPTISLPTATALSETPIRSTPPAASGAAPSEGRATTQTAENASPPVNMPVNSPVPVLYGVVGTILIISLSIGVRFLHRKSQK